MGDDMSYKLEEYYILNIKSYRLLEIETGEYWYPLSLFLRKFLFRNNNLNTYRDNDKYNQYMRVIEYDNPDSATDTKTKAWFMSTEGLYILLQNTRINNTGSAREKLAKEKYLAAAQNFFGVIPNNPQDYIGYQPDLSDYDVWSIMCLTRDTSIDNNTIWKRCTNCGFYYPYNKKYFVEASGYLSNKCKQCFGLDFVCENKRLQYLHNNNGLDLIYQFYLNDKDKIVEEFKKWLSEGGI